MTARLGRWRGRELEKEVQTRVKQLLALAGVAYYDTSQPFRALITPGLPDLICFAELGGCLERVYRLTHDLPTGILFFVECKASNGRLSEAQRRFQRLAEASGLHYVVGGRPEVERLLVEYGIAQPCGKTVQLRADVVRRQPLRASMSTRHGGAPTEWPTDLHVREWP